MKSFLHWKAIGTYHLCDLDGLLEVTVTSTKNGELCHIHDAGDIKVTFFSMGSYKALGLDGF